MSLINKVLLDLESRTPGGDASQGGPAVFADLLPVGVTAPPGNALKWISAAIAGVIILAAAGAGYFKFALPERASPVMSPVSRGKTAEAVPPHKIEIAPMNTPSLAADNPHTASPLEEAPAPPSPADAQTAAAAPITTSSAPAVPVAAIETAPQREKAMADDTPASAGTAPKEGSRFERTLHPLSPAETAENFYRKGVTFFRLGKGQEGELALRAALAADPAHTRAREVLAMVLVDKKRFDEAKKILSQGIELLPGYAPFPYRLALMSVDQGDEAGALALLETHRAQTAPDAAYLGLLATLYQRAARHEEARDTFRQALALRSDESRWWTGLGISLEALQDWAAARDAYQHSLLNTQTEPRVRRYAEQRLAAVSRHIP